MFQPPSRCIKHRFSIGNASYSGGFCIEILIEVAAELVPVLEVWRSVHELTSRESNAGYRNQGGRSTMGSKQRETVLGQKAYFEEKLKERRSSLIEKGIAPEERAKDGILKKISAQVRKTNVKIRALDAIAKRTEELANRKAEKLAAPPKPKKEKKVAEEPAKGKDKKKKKKEATENK